LVDEKIYFEVGELNICQSSAHKSAQKEKYFEYQKSLTPFSALIAKEHFGQIS